MMPLLRTIGSEIQADAELLPFDRNVRGVVDADSKRGVRRIRALHHRHGNFAARKERRLFSRKRNEIGFRQTLDETLALERRQERVDADPMRVDDVREQHAER